MLELICEMPYNQTLFEEKYMPSYGGPGQWYWLCRFLRLLFRFLLRFFANQSLTLCTPSPPCRR